MRLEDLGERANPPWENRQPCTNTVSGFEGSIISASLASDAQEVSPAMTTPGSSVPSLISPIGATQQAVLASTSGVNSAAFMKRRLPSAAPATNASMPGSSLSP